MAVDTLGLDFGRDKPFYVYLYRDPRPSKKLQPIYVGKGTAAHDRADRHWRRGSHNLMLNRILSKIRADGLCPKIEIVAWFDSEVDAFSLEKALIERFGRRILKTGTLANITDGGEGMSGYVVPAAMRRHLAVMAASISDDTRAKRSAALTGRTYSAETIAKMSAARKGRLFGPCGPETKAKISARHLGNSYAKGAVRSPETRAKMAAAQRLAVLTRKGKPRASDETVARVIALREDGMLQKDIGVLVGLSNGSISNILNGRHASCLQIRETIPLSESDMPRISLRAE